MRDKLIAGNWKMNGTKQQTADLLHQLLPMLADLPARVECVVCPPSVYLDQAHSILQTAAKGTQPKIELGAQNIASELTNSYTGEISAAMLREFGCKYVIIGHSERRRLLHESDELIARKVDVALESGLRAILCVGETKEQLDAGQSFAVVAKQLHTVLEDACIAEFKDAVIAYEPVWAIGTGLTATPEQAQGMHAHIRQLLAEYDPEIASAVRIIYGGSVNGTNAAMLLQQDDIDGCLVGGASLKAQEFSDICHAAIGITK